MNAKLNSEFVMLFGPKAESPKLHDGNKSTMHPKIENSAYSIKTQSPNTKNQGIANFQIRPSPREMKMSSNRLCELSKKGSKQVTPSLINNSKSEITEEDVDQYLCINSIKTASGPPEKVDDNATKVL